MRLVLPFLLGSVAVAAIACTHIAESASPAMSGDINLQRTAALPQQADDSYYATANSAIQTKIDARGVKPAKNVILFIGDGMGISTITAARIYAGQQAGVDGESYRLTMDTLPYSALSKTYSNDYQVADSAATATAMVTGLKTNSRMLGVGPDAVVGNCATTDGNRTDSLFDLAERAGLATGVISTARLTHATPAATYSESVHRDWEADSDMEGNASDSCPDIAAQFINWPEGDGFEIAMGGGRSKFLPSSDTDPEDESRKGNRGDGRNLMDEWAAKSDQHMVITDQAGFEAIDFDSDARVLGLFEASHMEYELDRAEDAGKEPSIAEMTAAALTRLSRDEDGFVLMVEGGRIDHAHHGVNAARALAETKAFDDAVAKALELTDPAETLIIVTADHSHTMTMAGYPRRGNNILGKVDTGLGADMKAADGKPYTTLSYANGQTACRQVAGLTDCNRRDLSNVDTTEKNFRQQSLVMAQSETHGGEDVAIFATGPGAELVSGVMEQNEIFHVMGRASGLIAEQD